MAETNTGYCLLKAAGVDMDSLIATPQLDTPYDVGHSFVACMTENRQPVSGLIAHDVTFDYASVDFADGGGVNFEIANNKMTVNIDDGVNKSATTETNLKTNQSRTSGPEPLNKQASTISKKAIRCFDSNL